MLKTDYPTIINGVTYEPFKTWDITNNDVVTTHETEGGTQEDVVIRKGRKSIAVSTTCLPAIANSLVQLEDLTEFPVKFFDVKTLGYVTLTMRVAPSSMTVSLKEGSSRLTVNGVYTVSFTLEEF
jgi:hypothetical protein